MSKRIERTFQVTDNEAVRTIRTVTNDQGTYCHSNGLGMSKTYMTSVPTEAIRRFLAEHNLQPKEMVLENYSPPRPRPSLKGGIDRSYSDDWCVCATVWFTNQNDKRIEQRFRLVYRPDNKPGKQFQHGRNAATNKKFAIEQMERAIAERCQQLGITYSQSNPIVNNLEAVEEHEDTHALGIAHARTNVLADQYLANTSDVQLFADGYREGNYASAYETEDFDSWIELQQQHEKQSASYRAGLIWGYFSSFEDYEVKDCCQNPGEVLAILNNQKNIELCEAAGITGRTDDSNPGDGRPCEPHIVESKDAIMIPVIPKPQIDYRAEGQLIEYSATTEENLFVVLVKTGNQPQPYVVARYRNGDSERCSGTYSATILEAATEYERQVKQYS